jgi:hypothetical protein
MSAVLRTRRSMKFFVSGKVGADEDVRSAIAKLRAAGHEITFDWTEVPHLKPYDANWRAAREAATMEAEGVKAADVLVLFPHEHGVGLFVELGVALGAGIPVRVVSTTESRTMFFHHPLVKRVKDFDEVLREFAS